MTSRHQARCMIVGANKVRTQTGKIAVNEDEWRALVVDAVETLQGVLTGRNEQRIDSSCQDCADFLLLNLRVFLGGREDQTVVLLSQNSIEGLCEFGKEGM